MAEPIEPITFVHGAPLIPLIDFSRDSAALIVVDVIRRQGIVWDIARRTSRFAFTLRADRWDLSPNEEITDASLAPALGLDAGLSWSGHKRGMVQGGGGGRQRLVLVDHQTGVEEARVTFQTFRELIRPRFVRSDQWLVAGGYQYDTTDRMHFWHPESGKSFTFAPRGVYGEVLLSPDTEYLAATGGTVRLWKVTWDDALPKVAWKLVCTFPIAAYYYPEFSHDSRFLASVEYPQDEPSGRIHVWNVASRQECAVVSGGPGAFVPESSLLAVLLTDDCGRSEPMLVLHDVVDNEVRARQMCPPGRLAASPDGRWLAVAADSEVLVWSVADLLRSGV